MTATNPISSTVPFDQDGEFHGFLSLPHSREDSAWGLIQIPISVFRNGDGPTALLTGANHGDEYEGPIALQSLAHDLSAEEIRGRVIIVPYMNYPAFRAAKRISPVDGLNMNRIFPGKPNGTVTEKIADYFLNRLIPLADIVLDYHSGGKSLDFIPFAAAHLLEDKTQEAACIAATTDASGVYELGGPRTYTFRELMELMLAETRRRRLLAPLPFGVAGIMAWGLSLVETISLGLIKNRQITTDQVAMLRHDNVVSEGAQTLADLGVSATAAEGVVGEYLYAYRPYGQYDAITESAANLKA